MHPVSACDLAKITGHAINDHPFQKENPTMEFEGYFKAIILLLALAVPIAFVIIFYRTLFSGLNSISKKPPATSKDAENPENTQSKESSEQETK